MRNQVNNAIKNAKRSYYYNTFKTYDCNSRKTWQVINEITSHKSVINELECNGKKTNNPTEIAETFNTFFSEISSELSKEIEDEDVSYKQFIDQTNEEFSFEIITPSQVILSLTKLCRSKATGLDSISARLLRECPDLIAKSLSQIFNQSIETEFFHTNGKMPESLHSLKMLGKELIHQLSTNFDYSRF